MVTAVIYSRMFDQFYVYMLDIIASKLYRPKTSNKKTPPKNICIINFPKKLQSISNLKNT